MPDAVPSNLLPYIEDCLENGRLTTVASTLNTPGNWLLTRFLFTVLTKSKNESEQHSNVQKTSNEGSSAVLVSLVRSTNLWIELGKKIGLDIVNLCKNRRLCYINGLSSSSNATKTTSMPTIQLKSLHLDDLTTSIKGAVQTTTNSSPESARSTPPVVLLDGLDFLFASQPDIGVVQLQQFLFWLRSTSHAVIITWSADAPLLHNRHEGATPLERTHASLLTTIAHQSSRIFQLRGLETGTAKDVTGVLRASNGGELADDGDKDRLLEDREWLYQTKGDGSVRIWQRGE